MSQLDTWKSFKKDVQSALKAKKRIWASFIHKASATAVSLKEMLLQINEIFNLLYKIN